MRGNRTQAVVGTAVALAAALAACASDFEKQSLVTRLRVLAVQAEPAELLLADGGPLPATTLTALAVEPGGAPITTRFALCLFDPTSGLPSADLDCPGDAGYTLPDAGPTGARLDLADPGLQAKVLPLLLGADGGTDGGADGGVGALLEGGLPVLVGFTAEAPAGGNADGGPAASPGHAGQYLAGLATVTLRSAGGRPANQNPALRALLLDGAEIAADGSTTVAAGRTVTLDPRAADGAKEATADGPEKLNFSFFATAGDLAALRSADTTATGQPGITTVDWTAPVAPGMVRFWVVIRDGRGGVGWLERSVRVQ